MQRFDSLSQIEKRDCLLVGAPIGRQFGGNGGLPGGLRVLTAAQGQAQPDAERYRDENGSTDSLAASAYLDGCHFLAPFMEVI